MTPHELAREVSTLFSLPDLVIRASAVMDSPTATAQDLIEVIELDANLALTVLRLSNSALYGGRGRIETLRHAVTLIGHNALRDLVLATAAVKVFRDIPAEFLDMETYWENSTTCGVLAGLIADYVHLRGGEALFLAGLLHSVGRLVFYVRRPKEYREVLRRVQMEGMSLGDAEQSIFGFSHADLGAALLETWRVPEKLVVAVHFQLNPESAPCFDKEVAAVSLASDLAANLAPSLRTTYESETYLPDRHASYSMQSLGLTPAALAEICLEAQAASLEVIEIINPCTHIVF